MKTATKPSRSNPWAQGWKIAASLVTQTLAGELYKDTGACLWEVVRNGACACMDPDNWEYDKAHVEILLAKNHALTTGGQALIVLDHGEGFTDARVHKYLFLGTPMEERRNNRAGQQSGASQKRIGRLATFALNGACIDGDDPTAGFFILTRTTAKGQVRMITIRASDIELAKSPEIRDVDAGGVEMGPLLKGIEGPFTAIVIPNPVFTKYEEIREALQWRVPRMQDKMFKLFIGGEQLKPPALPDEVMLPASEAGISAHIERIEDETKDGGLWIADAQTGLRVASCPNLGPRHLPYPLHSRGLRGDIFVPTVLAHQNSARDGFNPKFLVGAFWAKVYQYLEAHICPPAQALFKGEDVFGRDSNNAQVMELVEMFSKVWGLPNGHFRGPALPLPGGGRGHGGGGGGGGGGKGEKKDPKPRQVPIKIGTEEFLLCKRPLGSNILARLDSGNEKIIYLNLDGYEVWPSNKTAKQEHLIIHLLDAVAMKEYANDAEGAQLFRTARQQELQSLKKK